MGEFNKISSKLYKYLAQLKVQQKIHNNCRTFYKTIYVQQVRETSLLITLNTQLRM